MNLGMDTWTFLPTPLLSPSLQQLLQICFVDTSETSLVKTEEKSL